MKTYQEHYDSLSELHSDNAGSLTPDMVMQYLTDEGMLANPIKLLVMPEIAELILTVRENKRL